MLLTDPYNKTTLKAIILLLGLFGLLFFASSYEETSKTDAFALAMICIAFICSLLFGIANLCWALPNTTLWLRIDMMYHAGMVPFLALAKLFGLINVFSEEGVSKGKKTMSSFALILNFFNIIAYGMEALRMKKIEQKMNEASREHLEEIFRS